MLQREKYRFKDDVTDLSARELDFRFFDIDGRLHVLELLKVSWEAAVAEIQEHGLERINGVIAPVLDEVNSALAEAEATLGSLQADQAAIQLWWDSLAATIALLEAYTRHSYLYVDAAAMGDPPDGVAPAEATYIDTGGVRVEVRAFDGAAAEHIQFKVRAPDDWDGTSKAKLTWMGADGCATAAGVAWVIKAVAAAPGQAPGGAWGDAVTMLDAVATPGDQEECTSEAITAGGSPDTGSMVYFDLARDPDHASDDMEQDAAALSCAIQFGTTGLVEAW